MKTSQILAWLITLNVGSAWALPTMYPDQPDRLKSITNETNSAILADDSDPSLYWVLPPMTGVIDVYGYNYGNTNIGFCDNIARLQVASRNLEESIARNVMRLGEIEERRNRKKEAWLDAAAKAEELRSSNETIRQIEALEDRITAIETRLSELYTMEETCRESACEEISAEIRDLRNEKRPLGEEVRRLRVAAGADYRNYDRKRKNAEQLKLAYDEVQDEFETTHRDLLEAREDILEIYAEYGRMEGGFATYQYKSGWEENIRNLQNANPRVHFRPVRTTNVSIHAAMIGASSADSYWSSLPAVLDYTVNGMAFSTGSFDEEKVLPAFPPEFIGNLRMGLLGACASKFPEKFNVMKHESGLPKFGLAIQYEYESVFRTNITFKYNLYKFFEVIRKSGSRGGLFSSKSWSSVTEKEGGEDAFHVSWDEEDPDNVISETDKREIEKEIKAELIARVLRMMAIPAIGPQQGLAPVPPMPENGAVIAARGLEQGCGHLSHYCVAGSWILKVANGIFGSSRTEQSFRKEWDYEATETWSRTSARLKPGVTTFAAY